MDVQSRLSARQFFEVPSLIDVASIQVVANQWLAVGDLESWCYDDVENFQQLPHVTNSHGSEIEESLKGLNLPNCLFRRLKKIITPIGIVVAKWIYLNDHFFERSRSRFSISQFVQEKGLRWKWCGIIDYALMAKLLIEDERIEIGSRFQIACCYCFEPELREFWSKLTNEERDDYYEQAKQGNFSIPNYSLVSYWVYLLRGEIAELVHQQDMRTEKEYGLKLAAELGIVRSLEYFWNKMSNAETRLHLIKYAEVTFENYDSDANVTCYQEDVVYYTLLKLSEEQQGQLLRKELREYGKSFVLRSLLKWPWQQFFIPIVDLMWADTAGGALQRKLTNDLFEMLLDVSIKVESYNDTIYEHIFLNIWNKCPMDQKTSKIEFDMFQHHFYEGAPQKCLQVILRDLDDPNFERLIFSPKAIEFSFDLLINGKWKTLELLISSMLPRQVDKLRRFESKVFLQCANKNERDCRIYSYGRADIRRERWHKMDIYHFDELNKFKQIITIYLYGHPINDQSANESI